MIALLLDVLPVLALGAIVWAAVGGFRGAGSPEDRQARAEGWVDALDRLSAQGQGFSDPVAWKVEKTRRAAGLAQLEDEARKEGWESYQDKMNAAARGAATPARWRRMKGD